MEDEGEGGWGFVRGGGRDESDLRGLAFWWCRCCLLGRSGCCESLDGLSASGTAFVWDL